MPSVRLIEHMRLDQARRAARVAGNGTLAGRGAAAEDGDFHGVFLWQLWPKIAWLPRRGKVFVLVRRGDCGYSFSPGNS